MSPPNAAQPGPSFMSLMDVHRGLDMLLSEHQEGLITGDFDRAAERLRVFRADLLAHMCHEEDVLFPVYARAPAALGGSVDLLRAEHRKMVESLARIINELDLLRLDPEGRVVRTVEIIELEAAFKSLLHHHDLREGRFFYPGLDAVTSVGERAALIRNAEAA